MSIPRGTTPTFELTLESVDLTEAYNVYVSFSPGGAVGRLNPVLTKTGDDLTVAYEDDTSTVSVYLSQEETLSFGTGKVNIQLNWTYPDGSRAASEIATFSLLTNLLNEVVE